LAPVEGLPNFLNCRCVQSEEEDLPVELVLPRRNHLIELVALAQLLELRIIRRIELEALRVLAFDEWQGVEFCEGRTVAIENDRCIQLERLGRLGVDWIAWHTTNDQQGDRRDDPTR
jgi:hypothetical protein